MIYSILIRINARTYRSNSYIHATNFKEVPQQHAGYASYLYFASQVENDFPSNEMEMHVSFPLFLLQEQHEQQKYEKINIFLLNSISQDYIN